jgi:hypothetical protein
MIQITLNEYFIRLKYSFIAGFGRVFVFYTATGALIEKRIGQPD